MPEAALSRRGQRLGLGLSKIDQMLLQQHRAPAHPLGRCRAIVGVQVQTTPCVPAPQDACRQQAWPVLVAACLCHVAALLISELDHLFRHQDAE